MKKESTHTHNKIQNIQGSVWPRLILSKIIVIQCSVKQCFSCLFTSSQRNIIPVTTSYNWGLYSLYSADSGFSRPDTRLRRETCSQGTFLKACRDNKVQVKVRVSKRLENGLVVTRSFLARATSTTIASKSEGEITLLKELCTYMDVIIERLRRRQLFLK